MQSKAYWHEYVEIKRLIQTSYFYLKCLRFEPGLIHFHKFYRKNCEKKYMKKCRGCATFINNYKISTLHKGYRETQKKNLFQNWGLRPVLKLIASDAIKVVTLTTYFAYLSKQLLK